jgi:DNA-binding transcriptional regulator GbsR (MarR family)
MRIEDLTPAQLELLQKLSREETDEEKRKRLDKQAEEEKRAAEDAKKSPYRNFLQVNKDRYKEEAWLMRKSPIAYQVLRFITDNMDNYNALICSYKVIEESLEVSHSTVARGIRLLQEHNYLQIAKSGTTNIYMVNKELYWHSYGTNYTRAEFGAKIIISADEQEPSERENIKLKAKRYKAIEVEGEPQQKKRTEKATATATA